MRIAGKRAVLLCTLLAITCILSLAACDAGGTVPQPTATTGTGGTGGGSGPDKASVVAALEKEGLTMDADGKVEQPFLSVPGEGYRFPESSFQLYEYPDEAAAQQDAAKIQPNGEIPGVRVEWLAPPRFYRTGRVLIIYVGTDQKVISALEAVAGKPFAESQ